MKKRLTYFKPSAIFEMLTKRLNYAALQAIFIVTPYLILLVVLAGRGAL